jgi:trimethylamine--corrinoid protein Co-methyltransferase
MRSNYVVRQTAQFRLLSQVQLEELHLAALEVLRRTGVDVLEKGARELLKKAGVELDGVRARIPPHLVEWAIRTAPPRVTLCSRDGAPALYLEDTKAYYGTGSDTPNVIDPYTGERRHPVKADVANAARLCDRLPNIDFVMSMGIASDVTGNVSDLHHFEAMVSNTTKPIVCTAWNLDNCKDIVDIAEEVAGGAKALRQNPFIVMYAEPISPLRLAKEPTQKILYMAEKGLPVICGTGKVGGGTCPVTLAGALVQGNAEALTGLLLAQLKREGAPVIFGGERLHMDMSTTLCSYGAPEFMMSVAANAEMAAFYKLPSWSYAGCSDSKVFDQQAAFESAMMTFLSALSGGNLNHDVGYLDAGLTSSFDMVAASDEFIGMIKRVVGGIEISDEMLALDVIHQVGPGGEFLTQDHTLRHFKEDWFPTMLDRGNYDAWSRQGKRTLGQRANDKVKHILETHTPPPLPEAVSENLARIIERAERRVAKRA